MTSWGGGGGGGEGPGFRNKKLGYESQLLTVLSKNIKQFKFQISHFKLGIILAGIHGLFVIK